MVEVEVADKTFPSFEIVTNQGVEEMDINVKEMLPGLFGGKKKRRKASVAEAREILQAEEEGRLVDPGQVAREAVERAQSSGIVFLDEIDKVAGRESGRGPDVSREGVQRDLLPIVEGTSVNTKYGFVKTDHVLFIAAGAFHVSKPSDLIPELQGRFPIRVELDSLTEEDFVRILTEPENALLKQYHALLGAESVDLSVLRRGDPRDRARRRARQPRAREHRRAAPPHDPGAPARGDLLRRPRERGQDDPRSRSTTCAPRWRISSRTRTSRATSCEARRSAPCVCPVVDRDSRSLSSRRACGKKAIRQPPLPRGPRAVSDLAVEQEGGEAVLTFSYPDRLLTGAPLTDLARSRSTASTGATSDARGAAAATPRAARRRRGTDEAPGSRGPAGGAAARVAEEAFYRDAERVATLPVGALGAVPRGATSSTGIRSCRSSRRMRAHARLRRRLGPARRREEPALEHRDLSPEIPPARSVARRGDRGGRKDLPRVDRSRRTTCSAGPSPSAATSSIAARFPQEEYERSAERRRRIGHGFVDTGGQPTARRISTRCARRLLGQAPHRRTAGGRGGLDYRDIFPPPAPARLDALSEAKLVRLVWDPSPRRTSRVLVFRAEGERASRAAEREADARTAFFTDENVPERQALPLHRPRVDRPATSARPRRRPSPSRSERPLGKLSSVLPTRFAKMAGGGNDFLVFEADGRALPDEDRAAVALLCRRGLSVGADGALFFRRRDADRLRLDYFNADGGLASFCANGTRCAARYAVSGGSSQGRRPVLETGWAPIPARVGKDRVTLDLPALPPPGNPIPVSGDGLPAAGAPDARRRAAPRRLRRGRSRDAADRSRGAPAAPPSRAARRRERELRSVRSRTAPRGPDLRARRRGRDARVRLGRRGVGDRGGARGDASGRRSSADTQSGVAFTVAFDDDGASDSDATLDGRRARDLRRAELNEEAWTSE